MNNLTITLSAALFVIYTFFIVVLIGCETEKRITQKLTIECNARNES